jgi:hypothetical protein
VAQIPVYQARKVDTSLPQVQESVNYRGTNGEAIGRGVEAVGEGISRLASVGADLFKQANDRATNIGLAGMQTRFSQASTKVLDGYNDDKGAFVPGYLGTKGTEAVARQDDALEQLTKARDEIAASEDVTPQAKERFMLASAQMMDGAQRRIVLHQAGQVEATRVAQITAAKGTAIDELSNVYGDPKLRDESFKRGSDAITALSKSKEEQDAQLKELKEKGHAVVLRRYINTGNLQAAGAYYAKVQNELGAENEAIRSKIEEEEVANAGRLAAAGIATDAHYPGSTWIDPVKAEEKLAAMPAGVQKEQAKKYLDEEVKRSDARRKRAGDDMLDQLAAIKSQRGTLNTPEAREIVAWLKKPENGAVLPLQRYEKWLASEARSARADAEGRRAQDYANKVALARLETLDDDELQNFDPRRDPTFADADLLTVTKAVARQRTRLESADKSDAKTAAGIGQSAAEIRRNAKDMAGQNERLKTDPDLAALYTQSMVEFADDFEVKNKRRPNAQEMQAAHDQALMEHTVKRTGFFSFLGDKTEIGLKKDGPPLAPVVPKKVRVPKADRIQQLKSTGVSREEGLRILRSEGYQ